MEEKSSAGSNWIAGVEPPSRTPDAEHELDL